MSFPTRKHQRPTSPTPEEKRKEAGSGWSFSDTFHLLGGRGGQEGKQAESLRVGEKEAVRFPRDQRELLRLSRKEPISDEQTVKSLLSIWGQPLCSLPSFKVCL